MVIKVGGKKKRSSTMDMGPEWIMTNRAVTGSKAWTMSTNQSMPKNNLVFNPKERVGRYTLVQKRECP